MCGCFTASEQWLELQLVTNLYFFKIRACLTTVFNSNLVNQKKNGVTVCSYCSCWPNDRTQVFGETVFESRSSSHLFIQSVINTENVGKRNFNVVLQKLTKLQQSPPDVWWMPSLDSWGGSTQTTAACSPPLAPSKPSNQTTATRGGAPWGLMSAVNERHNKASTDSCIYLQHTDTHIHTHTLNEGPF